MLLHFIKLSMYRSLLSVSSCYTLLFCFFPYHTSTLWAILQSIFQSKHRKTHQNHSNHMGCNVYKAKLPRWPHVFKLQTKFNPIDGTLKYSFSNFFVWCNSYYHIEWRPVYCDGQQRCLCKSGKFSFSMLNVWK